MKTNLHDPLCTPYRFNGSAGQSFACFLSPGMNIRLVGEANDYVGKVCLKINVFFFLHGLLI